MDKIVGTIQSLSEKKKEGSYKQLKKFLQTRESEDVLSRAAMTEEADTLLSALDPTAHTVGWTAVICAKAVSPSLQADPARYIAVTRRLVAASDPIQVKVVSRECEPILQLPIVLQTRQNCAPQEKLTFPFPNLMLPVTFAVHKMADLLASPHLAMGAIRVLQMAIGKLLATADRPDTLTGLHSDLMRACLLARTYRTALPYATAEYLALLDAPSNTESFLAFHYYAGMVLTGLRKYRQAALMFQVAVAAPSPMGVSAIAAEAYKKYVLVSLVDRGTVPPMPRLASPLVVRLLKQSCAAYQEFASCYATGDQDTLAKYLSDNAALFKQSGNLGLAKRAVQSLYRHNISMCTRTYLTLALKDIAAAAKLPNAAEATRTVLGMIEDGSVHASITDADGMVRFLEDSEGYNTAATAAKLDGQIRGVMELTKKVRKAEADIATSIQYIQRTQRGRPQQQHNVPGKWQIGPMDTAFDDASVDFI